jgi:type IV pilus assembly protein PilW
MRQLTQTAAYRPGAADLASQRGYSLIEILVALLVALFLLAGLGTMVIGTRKTSTNQTALAQLQDEERLAMFILGNSLQSAGYFPLSATSSGFSNTADFPAATVTTQGGAALTLAAGQIIGGSHSAAMPGDSLVTRYYTSGTDNIINCNGQTSTNATTFTNLFFVNNSALECSIDGNTTDAVVIVNNVVNMQIYYGVTSTSTLSVDTYMTADQVQTAGDWSKVLSIKIILTFNNPLYSQPAQPQYVYFTRIIALQAQSA